MIVTGPISTETVSNLITRVSRVLCAEKSYDRTETSTRFWKPEVIMNPPRFLLEDNETSDLYRRAVQNKYWEPLVISPEKFAISVYLTYTHSSSMYGIKTDILDLSALEDLTTGQIIPDPIKRIFLHSYCFNDYPNEFERKLLREFIEYRDRMVHQAQDRLNRSISATAHHIVNDLHS